MLERAKKVGSTEPGHYLLPACRYRHTKEGKSAFMEGFRNHPPDRRQLDPILCQMLGVVRGIESNAASAGSPAVLHRNSCIFEL